MSTIFDHRLVFVALACLTIVSCYGDRKMGGRIRVQKAWTSKIPHMGDNNRLVIDGVNFDFVLGEYPYYLSVEELGFIIFVCRDEGYSYRLHCYDLNSKNDRVIEMESASFSTYIGREDGSISVEVFSPDKLIIKTPSVDSITRITELNLMDFTISERLVGKE